MDSGPSTDPRSPRSVQVTDQFFLNGPWLCHIFWPAPLNPWTMRVWPACGFDLYDPDPIILGLIFSFSL